MMSVEYRLKWKDDMTESWCAPSQAKPALAHYARWAGSPHATWLRTSCATLRPAGGVLRARGTPTPWLRCWRAAARCWPRRSTRTGARASLRAHGCSPLTPGPLCRALHFACGVGSDSCVRLLLANGADVSAEARALRGATVCVRAHGPLRTRLATRRCTSPPATCTAGWHASCWRLAPTPSWRTRRSAARGTW